MKVLILFLFLFNFFSPAEFEKGSKRRTIISLPSDFPFFTPSINLPGKSEGKIFIDHNDGRSYLMILNDDGSPFFYWKTKFPTSGFEPQPGGKISWNEGWPHRFFIVMDSTFTITDTLTAVNGYSTDPHELEMLPGGGYFISCFKEIPVDMSLIYPGGNPDALVIDNSIQEFDENKNLIFEWKGIDHFEITDAIHVNLLGSLIDFMHLNSIAVDYDNNLIISSRNLCEITKINRTNGEIIWRLGGNNNQFYFLNDSLRFSYQHDAKPTPGKPNHYTLFDNAKYSYDYSRVVEYYVDTLNMTVKKVWEFIPEQQYFSAHKGNAQRLPNGNTFANFALEDMPKAVEISPEGDDVLYQADFSDQVQCYRVFRKKCNYRAYKPYLIAEPFHDRLRLVFNHFGDTTVTKYQIFYGDDPQILLPAFVTEETSVELTQLNNNYLYYFAVKSIDSDGNYSEFSNVEKVKTHFVAPGGNILLNGGFGQSTINWFLLTENNGNASGSINSAGEYEIDISEAGEKFSDIQLRQNDITLIKGKTYELEFDGRSDTDRLIEVVIQRAGPTYTAYSQIGTIIIHDYTKHFNFSFEMNSPNDYTARLVFRCGKYEGNIFLDNIVLKEEGPVGIKSFESDRQVFSLSQNYPNPFNSATSISFFIPREGHTTLEIYDLLGRKVTTVLNDNLKSGQHSVSFSAKNLVSGVYFYKLESGNFREVRKMLYLK